MCKKIKVKIKEPPQDLKGFNICDTVFKGIANKVKTYGDTKYWYEHHDFVSGRKLFVGVIEFQKKSYFVVENNGKITSCIEM